MVEPGGAPYAAGHRQVCDNCKGNMAWDATTGRLKCEACGALRDAPAGAGGGTIAEHDLVQALMNQKPRGRIGADARQVKCNECGASVEFSETQQATKCDFCGSPAVLAQEARADLIQPEALVPFAVNRDGAVAAFKKWQGKLWFRPSNLREKSSVSELHGVYIPYWTFDCTVRSRWTADAGYHYYVDEEYTENGQKKTRKVQKTRWEPASGERVDAYDDHLICASRGVPQHLWRGVSDFQTSALVTYAPQYLQGYSAETYALELPDAWKAARADFARAQEQKCAGDVPGDTHRNLRVNNEWQKASFKHVLLPLWIAAYRYNGKVYRFLVNGQTGNVNGTAPYSALKIAIFLLVVVGALVGFWWLKQR